MRAHRRYPHRRYPHRRYPLSLVRGGFGPPFRAEIALIREEPAGERAEPVRPDLPLVEVRRRQGDVADRSGTVDDEVPLDAVIVVVLAGAVAVCRLTPGGPASVRPGDRADRHGEAVDPVAVVVGRDALRQDAPGAPA